jgi:hypothetical protein
MSDRIVRAVLVLYPRAFRRRYGPEVRDLVEELEGAGERSRLRLLSGLFAAATGERLRTTRAAAALSMITLVAVAVSATILMRESGSPTQRLTGVPAVGIGATWVTSAPPGRGPVVSGMAVGAGPLPSGTVDAQTWSKYKTSVRPPPPPPPTSGS